jgi:hypothetical protein
MGSGRERQGVGPDLVGDIPVPRDPIGPYDDAGDVPPAEPARRHAVGDDRGGHSRLGQLPGGEPATLQQRPGLVGHDAHPAAGAVRLVDRGERRPDPAGSERPGIAVGEHRGAFGNERETCLANPVAHGAVLIPDRGGLGHQRRVQLASQRVDCPGTGADPIQGPEQVDCGRPGGLELIAGTKDDGQVHSALTVEGRQAHTHRRGNANERCPTDP